MKRRKISARDLHILVMLGYTESHLDRTTLPFILASFYAKRMQTIPVPPQPDSAPLLAVHLDMKEEDWGWVRRMCEAVFGGDND